MRSLGWFGKLGCGGFLCTLWSSSGLPGVLFDPLLSYCSVRCPISWQPGLCSIRNLNVGRADFCRVGSPRGKNSELGIWKRRLSGCRQNPWRDPSWALCLCNARLAWGFSPLTHRSQNVPSPGWFHTLLPPLPPKASLLRVQTCQPNWQQRELHLQGSGIVVPGGGLAAGPPKAELV